MSNIEQMSEALLQSWGAKTLEALREKFDVANSAGRKFHVPCGGVAAGFGFAFQAARHFLARVEHGFDDGEMEFAAVDERLDFFEKSAAESGIAGGSARKYLGSLGIRPGPT